MSLLRREVGIPQQALIICAVTALWWLSLSRGALFSFPHLLWMAVVYFCPVVIIVFQAVLLREYLRQHLHPFWTTAGLLVGVSPLMFLAWLLVAYGP